MTDSPTIKEETTADFAGRKVLVVGLGRFGGGIGVTRWLVGQRADVTITDAAGADDLADSLEAIRDLDVHLHLGGHEPRDLDGVDLVVVNPAVDKSRSEFFREIRDRDIPWTTEINLFCQRCRGTVIGVTGTYGKSTTCAMLSAALTAAVEAGGTNYTGVHLGGNIGRSLLGELGSIGSQDLVVLELSDAQLADLPRIGWAPPFAVITNLSPQHLDRHGSWEAYLDAKLNIVRDPDGRSVVIHGILVQAVEEALVEAQGGTGDRRRTVTPADPPLALAVSGRHNQRNADCALAVAGCLGLGGDVVRTALEGFRGLPHRLEHVRTLNGVAYVNDSKSTAPAATITAIESINSPIVLIAGGQAKDVSLDEWAAAVNRSCKVVICMGESGPRFATALRDLADSDGRPLVLESPELGEAVRLAKDHAIAGDVVLLSPGAPSFDRYANFEYRGLHLAELVRAL